MPHKCKICGAELPEKGAVCQECGKEAIRYQNIFCSLVLENDKVKLKKCDIIVTERKFYIQDIHDRDGITALAFFGGIIGALIGSFVHSKQKKRFVCDSLLQNVEAVEYPLSKKYGSIFNRVKPERGALFHMSTGEAYIVRPGSKKYTAKMVEALKSRGVGTGQAL